MSQDTAPETSYDRRRILSFIGLALGRLGPRAHGAVTGVFLALLVAERTSSLLLVTFALTAHRFATWLAFPVAGRWSDRSSTSLGRRVPFMAAGLLVAGACTALYIHATSYWALVGLLVLARIAFVAYLLPSAAVTPEAFGNSRWLRAGLAVTVGGIVVGLSIRVTVLATWEQGDPSTWSTAYYLSAGYVIFAGLAIALLVREAPGAERLVRKSDHVHWRETLRSMFAEPNANILIASVLLAIAAGGAFSRAYPIYARDVLGAGGDALAAAGIWGAVLSVPTFALSWWLARKLTRKVNALLAGVFGCAGALAHLFVTELWQSVVIGAITQIFLVSAVVAMIPFYLRLIPRRGGLAERFGTMMAPTLLAGLVASFTTGFLFDFVVHDYRVIWIPTAIFGLAGGLVMLWLKVPPGQEHADPRRGTKLIKDVLWGKREGRSLFRGELDQQEIDGTLLLELVADELNPYMERF